MADQKQAQGNAPAPAFPTPTKVDAPPVGTAKPNPAEPIVRDAIDQGWQKFTSASEKDADKQRQLVGRAGKVLGVKVRTRTHKEGTKVDPLTWYMFVEREQKTDS